MGAQSFNEVWNRTSVQVVSPNEQIHVTILGDVDVRVSFLGGFFERGATARLHDELVAVAGLAVRAHTRAFFELASERAGHRVERRTEGVNEAGDEYLRRFAEVAAAGWSADGTVGVLGVGMKQFTVTFPVTAQATMSSVEFGALVGEAATGYLQDQRAKVAEIQYDIYWKPYLEPTQ